MEDIYSDPSGPHDYLLTAEEYDQLKNLQQLLLIMANVAYDEDQQAIESEPATIPRWEVQLSFRLISRLIGEALEQFEKRNHIERRDRVRH